MADREKVIRGLEVHCSDQSCIECPYQGRYCTMELASDTLAILREQKARVMTLEEVEKMDAKSDPDPVYAEWSTGRTGWIVGSIHLLAAMMKNENRDIRVWTSRPTPEQMRDTKWEEEYDG